MWLLILEAFAALAILLVVVWWTMFSGRPRGELPPDDPVPRGRADDAPAGGVANGVANEVADEVAGRLSDEAPGRADPPAGRGPGT